MLEAPTYSISQVGVGGSYSIGGQAMSHYCRADTCLSKLFDSGFAAERADRPTVSSTRGFQAAQTKGGRDCGCRFAAIAAIAIAVANSAPILIAQQLSLAPKRNNFRSFFRYAVP